MELTNRWSTQKPSELISQKTFSRVSGKLKHLVRNWYPKELESYFLSLSRSTSKILETARDAPIEVSMPALQWRLAVVSYKRLNQYVTVYSGRKYDFCIAEFKFSSNEMNVLDSTIKDKHALLDYASPGTNAMDLF